MTATAEQSRQQTSVRSCIGCRQRAERGDLVRHAARIEGARATIVRDVAERLPGRGAWLHDDPTCLQKALKQGAFRRALRIPHGIEAELALDAHDAGNFDGKDTSM